jgi:hypothetical protein
MIDELDKIPFPPLITNDPPPKAPHLTKNTATIYERLINQNSTCTGVYITSVIHFDIIALQKRLKIQYSKINNTNKIPLNTYITLPGIDNFEKDIKNINIENYNSLYDKNQSNVKLFLYSLFFSLISSFIEIVFTYSLIFKYINLPIIITKDLEQITIRFVSFCTLTVVVWMNYQNGKYIFNHSITQGYLYISMLRRIISALDGLIHMFISLSILFCFTMLVLRGTVTVENVKTLGSMIVLINIDNWIGGSLIQSNYLMKMYCRKNIVMIWCVNKKRNILLNMLRFIENSFFISCFICGFIYLKKSI